MALKKFVALNQRATNRIMVVNCLNRSCAIEARLEIIIARSLLSKSFFNSIDPKRTVPAT